jgi:D-3-phosphoglycerate dehydrogenase
MRLLIAADVDRTFISRVTADARFEVRQAPVRTEEELLGTIGDAQILVTRAYNKVTRRVIDAAPHLELVAQGTSGTDNIDAAATSERGITIISLPGENANAVAELVIAFILMMTRTIPFYSREVVGGAFDRDDCATRHEMRHHRLGIIGHGQVGSRVARLAAAFGMPVFAYDPYIDDFGASTRVSSVDELLATSDILTLHVPLTTETRRMIAEPQIRALHRGAYLINASRGEVLDQTAALAALDENHLGGLALDVFDPEPPDAGFPDDPRLVLTPHIGGCTFESKASIGGKLYEKVLAWLTQPPSP